MMRQRFTSKIHSTLARGALSVSALQSINPMPLVAWSRFALAVFALIAIYADPVQPARHSQFAYYLLTLLVIYSGVLVVLNRWIGDRGNIPPTVHAIDIVVFSFLIFLTDGATSPFFIFFTFAMFSATLVWNWQGAVFTTLATVTIYGLLTVNSELSTGLDITRTIVRNAYLIIAGILFAYFGAILSGQRVRLAKLAAWPSNSPTNSEFPDLLLTYAHIAEVTGVNRTIVVWETPFEPHLFLSEYDGRKVSTRTIEQGLSEVVASLSNDDKLEVFQASVLESAESEPIWLGSSPRTPFKLVTPIGRTTFQGYLITCHDQRPSDDIIALFRISANQISSELEQHHLRLKLVKLAVEDGRIQLARDIHDGLLQTMAAIALQLKAMETELTAEQISKIKYLRDALNEQQVKLRSTITAEQGGAKAQTQFLSVETELRLQAVDLERKWKCDITLTLMPPNAYENKILIESLKLFIAEAVANGVRHGAASQFMISLLFSATGLQMSLRDNGRGLHGVTGNFESSDVFQRKIGSASLRKRASGLAGDLSVSSSSEGVAISLKVPIK
jgi:signal transduction histidine kinase